MPRFQYQPVVPDVTGSIGDLLLRRGQIAATRAQQVGQAQAQGQQQGGAAWANAIGSIGQIAAGVPGQLQQARSQALTDETRQIQNEQGRMQIAGARKAAEDASILQSAQSSRLAPDQVKAQLQELGRGDLVPLFEKTWTDLEASRLTLQELRAKASEAEADYFGNFAAGIKAAQFDPLAIEWALSEAQADGHDVSQIRTLLAQQPDAVPQIIDQLLQQSPTQRDLMGKEQERALKTETERRQAAEAAALAADRSADNDRQRLAQLETERHNREQERISGLTAGREAASLTETQRHNRAMEENARNTKIGRPVLSGDVTDLSDFDTALDDVSVLRQTISGVQGATGTAARIGAALPNVVTEVTGWGTDAKQKQAVIDRVKQVIGKTLEGGVLRKEDEYKYTKILPTIGDPPDVVETKLNGLEEAVAKRKGRRLDALQDAGFDVSKFRARGAGPSTPRADPLGIR